MEAKDLAYRISVTLTGLNLLTFAITALGAVRQLDIVSTLAAADRDRFLAVLTVELFLLASILATTVSVTLFVRRGAREAPHLATSVRAVSAGPRSRRRRSARPGFRSPHFSR